MTRSYICHFRGVYQYQLWRLFTTWLTILTSYPLCHLTESVVELASGAIDTIGATLSKQTMLGHLKNLPLFQLELQDKQNRLSRGCSINTFVIIC